MNHLHGITYGFNRSNIAVSTTIVFEPTFALTPILSVDFLFLPDDLNLLWAKDL
jgi:hypothetical protein